MDQVKEAVNPVLTTKEKLQVQEEIEVPLEVAIQAKMSEFDKAIAAAEFEVARVKKERSEFLHDQNLVLIKRKYQKPTEAVAKSPNV